MTRVSRSYLRVQYDLRPAKQVERRIFIESFQLLAEVGFPIRDYQYTGMGSIHFVDFAMFHKFLGINRLLSVEIESDIDQRLKFNTPYAGCVKVVSGQKIGEYIPQLSNDCKHVLWLDYDNLLSNEMLRDVSQAITMLPDSSILLVTVDTEPPRYEDGEREGEKMGANDTRRYFEEVAEGFADYLTDTWVDDDFEWDKLPDINAQLLIKSITEGLKGRSEPCFVPLFHFLYSDGHRMLTIGGMVGTKKDRRKIMKSRLAHMDYVRLRFEEKPFWIRVPKITRKERLYLDSNMPSDPGWKPKEFEMSDEDLENYRSIY
ncbi:MAG: O-methyltransferase, partial [Promethearchaeota archaeon]